MERGDSTLSHVLCCILMRITFIIIIIVSYKRCNEEKEYSLKRLFRQMNNKKEDGVVFDIGYRHGVNIVNKMIVETEKLKAICFSQNLHFRFFSYLLSIFPNNLNLKNMLTTMKLIPRL